MSGAVVVVITGLPGSGKTTRSALSGQRVEQLSRLDALGPWGLGVLLTVDTSAAYDVVDVADRVRSLLPAGDRPIASGA